MNPNDYMIKTELFERELQAAVYNSHHEAVFIAGLMANPSYIHEAQAEMQPEHLMGPVARAAYQTMLLIYECDADLSFEPESLIAMARKVGTQATKVLWESTAGSNLLYQIHGGAAQVTHERFRNAVRELRDAYTRAKLYRHARHFQQQLLNLSMNPDAANVGVRMESDISKIISQHKLESDLTLLADEEDQHLLRVRLNYQYPQLQVSRITVNQFPRWMKVLGGESMAGIMRPGVTVLAARAKSGKTTMLLNIAHHVSQPAPITLGSQDPHLCQLAGGDLYSDAIPTLDDDGEPVLAEPIVDWQSTPVLFLDTEMTRGQVYSRELSLASGLHEQQILSGKMFKEGVVREKVETAMAAMRNRKIYYANVAGQSPDYVISILRRFRNQVVGTITVDVAQDDGTRRPVTVSRPALVVYDWLKLPEGTQDSKEHIAFGHLTTKLNDAARELDLPILAGAQHNQDAIKGQVRDWSNDHLGTSLAASDRIKWFAVAICHIRNLTVTEMDDVIRAFGRRVHGQEELVKANANGEFPAGFNYREGRCAPLFNQLLVVTENRVGDTELIGIPLFHDFGGFNYQEVSLPHTEQHGNVQVTTDLLQRWVTNQVTNARKKREQAKAEADKPKSGSTAALTVCAPVGGVQGTPPPQSQTGGVNVPA